MTVQIFTSPTEAIRAKSSAAGSNYYGIDGKIILATSLGEARQSLTSGLKKLSHSAMMGLLEEEVVAGKPEGSGE